MRKTFLEFLSLKEETEGNKKAPSEVKLSDDADFKPFIVDDGKPGLRILVKAFLNSPQVNLPGPDGYPQKLTTMDAKGETTPKLKKKSLFLVGGAVRDHLKGKTPKDYDLATDATPDEIRLILRNAGFTETKPNSKSGPIDKKYEKHPEAGDRKKVFSAKGWDRAGKEYVICAKVNGTEYEIATFRKDSKGGDGRTPDNMEFGTLDDDASRRDLTINSMYIPLTNGDGANAKLIDPHGGAHDIRNGEVKFVGNAKERLDEDQLRALRYIRFIASHGKNTKIPEEVKAAISDIKDLPAVSRERIRDEFLKGLKHPDVDPIHYVKMFKDLGLIETVFPDLEFKLDKSEDFSDKKEPRLALAWLLRNNSTAKIESALQKGTWSNDEIRDIVHLVELEKWMSSHEESPEVFLDKFYEMKKKFHRTGMVPSLVKQWGKMNKMSEKILHKFLSHVMDTKGYVDEDGVKKVNPKIIKHLGGKSPKGEDFGNAIKDIETEKFVKNLSNSSED
jgi:tRNA nucleotidyltransferase/poly(A) polymerase